VIEAAKCDFELGWMGYRVLSLDGRVPRDQQEVGETWLRVACLVGRLHCAGCNVDYLKALIRQTAIRLGPSSCVAVA
jgi:hypothetical protein